MTCLAVLATTATGCGSDGDGTALERALSKVPAGQPARTSVSFDDTAGLTKVAGKGSGSSDPGSYAGLRGYGSGPVLAYSSQVKGLTPAAATFTVTAGTPPRAVSLLSGGQDSGQVADKLTAAGYRRDGKNLAAPGLGAVKDPTFAGLTLSMAKFRASGHDIAYGGSGADLSDLGSPSGKSLADDPLIKPLADCLGDVVAADFEPMHGASGSVEFAVGVRRPSSGTSVPQVVGCGAFSTAAQANDYRGRAADPQGVSARTREPWTKLLPGLRADVPGGPRHLVRWTATSPGRVRLVFDMLRALDLPGLPSTR
ncbi:hypothetical protein [Actinomadura scrupuli]|uniref:hypothetical protein n=1 Tax=Actinomadura scrupuli TaxID=559629 RepID=UPI003D96C117